MCAPRPVVKHGGGQAIKEILTNSAIPAVANSRRERLEISFTFPKRFTPWARILTGAISTVLRPFFDRFSTDFCKVRFCLLQRGGGQAQMSSFVGVSCDLYCFLLISVTFSLNLHCFSLNLYCFSLIFDPIGVSCDCLCKIPCLKCRNHDCLCKIPEFECKTRWVRDTKKWEARIRQAGAPQQRLGYYLTEAEAAMAFDDAARRLRGDAAHGGRSGPTAARFRLNFPTKIEERNMGLGLTEGLTGNEGREKKVNQRSQYSSI